LQSPVHVNRLSEPHPGAGTPAPVDPERHALEVRIEHAKSRIVEDLDRAVTLVRGAAARAGRGLGTLAALTGVFLAAIVITAVVRRRRPRRIPWL
jgi:hypothetical protein